MQQVHKYQEVLGVPSHDDCNVSVLATNPRNLTFKPGNLTGKAATTQSLVRSSGSNTERLTTVEITQKWE